LKQKEPEPEGGLKKLSRIRMENQRTGARGEGGLNKKNGQGKMSFFMSYNDQGKRHRDVDSHGF
jgi:hypothetical protein